MALKLLPEELSDVPARLADRYEAQADRYWDQFYRRNTTKFFKDRHYLHKEFPDLAAGPATLLEVGCGVGNTVFPLLEINPALRIHCCDFAPSAIELVRQNPLYDASGGAVHAFVADITADMLAAPPEEGGCGVPAGGCDLATMIFVLSAIHPQRMAAAVHNVARCLRPGTGRLLFRDYAEGDLAMERLAGGDRPKRLGHNFYVRGDGTRCYYFGQDEVLSLFASAGFACERVTLHERTVVNHKRDIAMDRRWLQVIFTLREPRPPPLPLRELLAQPHPMQCQAANPASASAAPAGPVNGKRSHDGTSSSGGGGGDGGGGASNMDVDSSNSSPEARAAGPAGTSGTVTAAADMDVSHIAANGCSLGGRSGGSSASPSAPAHGGLSGCDGGGSSGGGVLGGGSWLTGAAGRLASHLAAGPGLPSGRALLPDSLDPADELVAELSPSPRQDRAGHHHQQDRLGHPHHSPLQNGCLSGSPEGACRGGEGREGGGGGAAMQVDGAEAAGIRGGHSLERQLEAEFFATIGRDSREVVAEEVAAAGAALARVRLADVAELAAARLAAAAAAAASTSSGSAGSTSGAASSCSVGVPAAGTPSGTSGLQGHTSPAREVDVAMAPGVSFRCLCGVHLPSGSPNVPLATLALSRVLLASPRLLGGKTALQLGPASPVRPDPATAATPLGHAAAAPSGAAAAPPPAAAVLPAMAAVRGSARRVVVTEAGRDALVAAAADLRRNAHAIVIERLRLVTLDWAAAGAAAGGSAAAAAATGAAGYTFVSGAVRQLRDVLQLQPAGFDLVYAADPLAELTAAAAGAPQAAPAAAASAGEAAIAAARCLFDVAAQLLHPSVAATSQALGSGSSGRLLLLCFPADWAAAHGMGFAALAGVCGWELLVPEQLAAVYGVDAGLAASAGCAVMGFRRRMAQH